jgi:hypothetical protein
MINLYLAVNILAAAKVDFVVIGGMALRSHGSGYLTQDLDICYSRKRENLERIVSALREFRPRPRGFPDGLPFVWDWSTLQNGTNFTFKTTLCDIDLLAEVPGLGTYDDAVANSETVEFEGVGVQILSIDALILTKTTAGRKKDEAGLEELYALKASETEE